MSTDEAQTIKKTFYSRTEEAIHALTHGTGAALSVAGLVDLVVLASSHGAYRIVATSVYGATLVAAYTSSTLYHAWPNSKIKRFFRKLDHVSIYLLIAGSYTPFTLVALHPAWGWPLFGVVWALAVVGTVRKFVHVGSGSWVDVALYIGMGWIAVVAVQPLYAGLGTDAFIYLVAGGLSYTLGTIFYLYDRIPYNHAIWHLFVMGGSLLHFLAVTSSNIV